ncbi:MAG TPA: HAMP domain-containing histidine kinase [Persephonella sp.]|nr:HAMP domain-containing histidine kinase [Persephonella sp.]
MMKFLKNRYEKESFLKSFLLFFISMFIFISLLFIFYYKNLKQEKLYSLYLEMKNYSLTLKGDKFETEIVSPKKTKFYELLENGNSYYIDVPIPFLEKEVLRIKYNKNKFRKELFTALNQIIYIYVLSVIMILVLSFLFSIYSLSPLRRAYLMLDESVKDIIHDINTPVSSILINMKILKSKYKDDEDVENTILATKQLSNIYNNLKSLIKETEKNIQEVNLKDIIKSEINFFRKVYPEIKVETELNDLTVRVDKTVAERIITNLLSNAFKHNIKNGYVKIKLHKELVIKNSSPYIKNPDKLFDRYYKEADRGIGIGLSIVKKLCLEIGWEVSIRYEEGEFTAQIKL